MALGRAGERVGAEERDSGGDLLSEGPLPLGAPVGQVRLAGLGPPFVSR